VVAEDVVTPGRWTRSGAGRGGLVTVVGVGPSPQVVALCNVGRAFVSHRERGDVPLSQPFGGAHRNARRRIGSPRRRRPRCLQCRKPGARREGARERGPRRAPRRSTRPRSFRDSGRLLRSTCPLNWPGVSPSRDGGTSLLRACFAIRVRIRQQGRNVVLICDPRLGWALSPFTEIRGRPLARPSSSRTTIDFCA